MQTRAYRIGTAVSVLVVLVAVLPIRLHRSANEPLLESCVRLADHPPPQGPQAIAELERCAGLLPSDVELLADLGAAYEDAQRHADAESTYQAVLKLDPQYADVRARLAALLLHRGALTDARSHAEIALRIQPNRSRVRELLDTIERRRTP